MSNLSSLSYYIPELIIISAILLIIILDIIPSTKPYTFNLALASIIASAFFLCQNHGESHSLFMGMIALDPFSHYFKYIFLFATFSIILISRFDRQLDKKYASEYNCLLLIVLLGLFLMSSSVNLLMIYLSIELVSIPSYILAGMLKNDKESNEASLKYVIFGSLASGLMLFGLSILYGITGSTDISGISSALQIIEFPLTIYFPLILILAGFAILIRIFYTMFTVGGISEGAVTLNGINWPALIAVASAITMTLGNLLAIQQKDVKRLLAYSSISHVGFMLMAFVFISPEAVRAIMLYLFIYLFMNLSAFYMAIFASNKLNAHVIDDWKGMGRINPILSAFMVLSLLSLTGLPPTAGFVGKVYVFAELFKHQQFYWLAVVAILNSVVSLYYYFSIVKAMYLDEVETPVEAIEAHSVIKWSIILFSAQNLLFFIYWEPLIEFIDNSIHLFEV